MTFSYSLNPKSSLKDEVRFLIGDTKSGQPLLQDEEIRAVLDDCGNVPGLAAIVCCEAILSQMARMRDQSVGDVSISASQVVAAYEAMLTRLRGKYAQSGDFMPYAGGISRVDKRAQAADPDRVRPDFTKDDADGLGLGQYAGPNYSVWAAFEGAR